MPISRRFVLYAAAHTIIQSDVSLCFSCADTHSFRTVGAGPTKFAMFGDMGVFEWNNMGNLLKEMNTIDAILMLGDHC
jgi:hypothetical protein